MCVCSNVERLVKRGLSAHRRTVPEEIERERVELRDIVGKGAFGDVRHGVLVSPSISTDGSGGRGGKSGGGKLVRVDVAVKTYSKTGGVGGAGGGLTSTVDDGTALAQLLDEATLMAQFKHPNVIRLLGTCAQPGTATHSSVPPLKFYTD